MELTDALVNKQWTIGTTKSRVEMSLINADPLEALGTTEELGLTGVPFLWWKNNTVIDLKYPCFQINAPSTLLELY